MKYGSRTSADDQGRTRLCSYVVVVDTGFAPNPFGNFCTLAACTPNHQGVRLKKDDWLLGNSSTREGARLIFAMRISEVHDFDYYYNDPRFAEKKPDARTWQGRCGDNIYFRGKTGWLQARTAFNHKDADTIRKDTRYPRVFISDHFFYFGENALVIPKKYSSLVRKTQGCCCRHDPEVVRDFIGWIEQYPTGRHGAPRDRDESKSPDPLLKVRRTSTACQKVVDKPKKATC
jgi:Nucleotide modification associated domain 2